MQKISSNQKFIPNFKELLQYKDLLYFLVLKDIKSRYAQSIIGVGWAIIKAPPAVIEKIAKFGKSYKELTLDTVKKFLKDRTFKNIFAAK